LALGQLEAFDPPAAHRVRRRGGGGWAGVDPSTRRCAIAVTWGEESAVDTVSFPTRLEGAQRLAAIFDGVRELGGKMLDGIGVIAVEQPSGKQENPALSYAVGATLAAIGALYGDRGPFRSRETPVVVMVPSSKWKKVACGAGNIYKPKPASGEKYGVLTWAHANGYAGASWDEADALGIAKYARRTYAIETR
jgi:Holliday junction resolvasome RuvABC endonuclease subunit